jgi:hypothetical protein
MAMVNPEEDTVRARHTTKNALATQPAAAANRAALTTTAQREAKRPEKDNRIARTAAIDRLP